MHSGSWIFIILLSFVIISSVADPETLNASVGGNVTLPDAVEEEGFLYYGGQNLALVQERKLFKNYGELYQKTLHWNQTTGRFTLTGLQKSDSGIYRVASKTGRRVNVQYNLMVDDPAENKPAPSTASIPVWIPIVSVCVVSSSCHSLFLPSGGFVSIRSRQRHRQKSRTM
ncbi:unnamed protein product [Ophioblennius macclurei]